jgi:hypothetical protein
MPPCTDLFSLKKYLTKLFLADREEKKKRGKNVDEVVHM